TTVRRAFDELVQRGLGVRRQGAGSFAAANSEPKSRTGTNIGVLIPDTQQYYPRVLQGIEDTLAPARVGLQLATSGYEPAQENAAVEQLLATGVDGMILVPTLIEPVDGPARIAELMRLPVPVVFLERSLDDLGPCDRTEHVCSDHQGGAYDAVHHLWLAGHRRIGLLARTRTPTGAAVVAGYRRAVADLGLVPVLAQAPMAEWRANRTEPMVTLLRERDCTAVLTFGDTEALLLQRAVLACGMAVPGDLAMVSYDDESADTAVVPLTAVAPAKHRLGVMAAQLLLRRLTEGEACPLHQIRLRPRLVVRDSCGCRVDRASAAGATAATATADQGLSPRWLTGYAPVDW
ncbi:MAG: substrate-binding domain-containing protein, partial [Propionibacteriaceae bacterium]